VSGTEIRRFSDDQSLIGGRWIVALLQAISTSLATGLALPVVVLAAWVAFLTEDLYRIALVPVLAFGLWNLGALVAGRICHDRLRLLPWAFGASAIRAGAMAAIGYLAYHNNPGSDGRLRLFLVALGIFGFASGFVSVPLESLLQKSFESSSRAQLFLGRAFWGVIAALVSGIVVRSVFENDGPATQRAFAYLFIAAAGCLASAAFFTLLIKEPVRRLSTARHDQQSSPLSALGDRVMRRYLLFRIALAAVAMLDVFIVVYALRELAFDRTFLGIYVIAFCGALAICLPLSRSLSSRRGGRATLQSAVWLKLIAPLLMLTIPYLQDSADVAEHVSGDRFYLWMLAACFAALGASLAFQGTGNFQYLSEIAPAIQRTSYFATANVVLMFATLFPLVGAWILEGWDFQRLFGVSAAVALLAVLLSGILVDTRIVASRPTATPRLSRVSIR
jgi:MFS family permease